jgi:hypothetical protein
MFCHLPLFLAAPVVATLILAGTPAQATGYQLLLCQDADAPQCPLRVVIQEKDSGRITSMELQPGKALDLRDDQNYGFQFINKLGPERPSQEANAAQLTLSGIFLCTRKRGGCTSLDGR